MTKLNWTRVNNDVNGNPRYVVHFLDIQPMRFRELNINNEYKAVIKFANKLGGRKFHNKQYGGGIVFQSYNLDSTERFIFGKIEEDNKKYLKEKGLGNVIDIRSWIKFQKQTIL